MDDNQPDKKELILEAASSVFKRYGYNKTSIADIAQEARLGKGTIYYYFDSKEDIYVEILKEQAKELFQQIDEMMHGTNTLTNKLKFYISMPGKILVEQAPMIIDIINGNTDVFLQKISAFKVMWHDRMMEQFEDLIIMGQKEGELRVDFDAHDVTGVLHRWLHFWMSVPSKIVQEIVIDPAKFDEIQHDYNVICDILLYGLLKREDA